MIGFLDHSCILEYHCLCLHSRQVPFKWEAWPLGVVRDPAYLLIDISYLPCTHQQGNLFNAFLYWNPILWILSFSVSCSFFPLVTSWQSSREVIFLRLFMSENIFIPSSLMINCQSREFEVEYHFQLEFWRLSSLESWLPGLFRSPEPSWFPCPWIHVVFSSMVLWNSLCTCLAVILFHLLFLVLGGLFPFRN